MEIITKTYTHLNTSHVILYPAECRKSTRQLLNLNTSHVILYPEHKDVVRDLDPFKYISCYSLSFITAMKSLGYVLFKYISCYSLSSNKSI